jgi:Short C-terminal domain
VLASILAFAAILSVWANRQILNTDNWTNTSSELLENRTIRNQLAGYLVDQLYANVDVAAEIREGLPPRLQPLAGPAAGGLRELAERAARQALARPRVQERWAAANRTAQQQLLKTLEGGGTVVSTTGGDVVLDLTALLTEMQERIGIGGRVADRLPASAATITVMRSERLKAAQRALKILKGLPIVLVTLSLALFAAALALAPGWRREALRAYGIGFVIGGAAALITQVQAGEALVNALAKTAAVEPTIAATWTISTTLLVQAAWATIGYGVFMVLAAWLAGPSRPAVALRRMVAPYVSHSAIAYAAFAVFVALLLWWAPTPALRDAILALILIALLAIGWEALRRQIGREHPDADMHESIERMRERGRSGVSWVRQGTSTGRTAVAGTASRVVTEAKSRTSGAPAADERLEQLERLARLKESGVLDQEEFAAQKRAILAGAQAPGADAPADPAG